jgi:thioredoxin reductase
VSEENEEVVLSNEEVQEVIEWAVAAGALITLLHSAPNVTNEEEMQERLDACDQAIEIIYHNMPETLEPSTHEIAEGWLEEVEEDERIVNTFKSQLEDVQSPEDLL